MTKVITYGTYDLMHYGHVRLLERAKALGDYLIVGVTAEDFDKQRGKINVKQSLEERIANVRATGLADQIIVEEYEGQKIDDIKRYDVDIFTVGSDWVGVFDYLNDFCKVVYLDRTQGISSTQLRQENSVRIGIVGASRVVNKFGNECGYVNGIEVAGVCTDNTKVLSEELQGAELTGDFTQLLTKVDAVYIYSTPELHYDQAKQALLAGKHVLCESPIALKKEQCIELFQIAKDKGLVLQESIKTAYSLAYSRLVLLAKGGKIGKIVSVDTSCTSLKDLPEGWGSLDDWGPTAMLPVLQLLGTDYRSIEVLSQFNEETGFDSFTKVNFRYDHSVASVKVANGVKSEGELIVSGTKGYIYVPAPWWKTDYFEVRFENPDNNKRYFYQLDGEGIRFAIVSFIKAIEGIQSTGYIEESVSEAISGVIEYSKENAIIL